MAISQEAKDLYSKYGYACHHAHAFETEISNIYVMFCYLTDRKNARSKGNNIDNLRKATIGRALEEIGKSIDSKVSLDALFNQGLSARNYLIHNFFIDFNDFSDGSDQLINGSNKLSELISILENAMSTSSSISEKYFEKAFPGWKT